VISTDQSANAHKDLLDLIPAAFTYAEGKGLGPGAIDRATRTMQSGSASALLMRVKCDGGGFLMAPNAATTSGTHRTGGGP
jgi:hypothetical protein